MPSHEEVSSYLKDLTDRGQQALVAANFPLAEVIFKAAIRVSPRYWGGHYFLGTTYLMRGWGGEAVDPFKKSVELAPEMVDARSALGVALVACGRRTEGEEAYKVAAGIDPQNLFVWLNSGEQFTQERRWEEALDAYHRAQLIAPNNPAVDQSLVLLHQARARGGRGLGPDFPGIAVIIHTLNEEGNIRDALRSVLWANEIVLVDTGSTDRTLEIAAEYPVDKIVKAAPVKHIEPLRRFSADQSDPGNEWVYFHDADERVPAKLVPIIYNLIHDLGNEFSALRFPMKNYHLGKWRRRFPHWPGYPQPKLFHRDRFEVTGEIHHGLIVRGEFRDITYDDPGVAIDHYTFPTVSNYLEKLNSYTEGEREAREGRGEVFSWREAVAEVAGELALHLDTKTEGYERDMGDLILAFLAGVYDFTSCAKLYEEHARRGNLSSGEMEKLPSARQFVEEMLRNIP